MPDKSIRLVAGSNSHSGGAFAYQVLAISPAGKLLWENNTAFPGMSLGSSSLAGRHSPIACDAEGNIVGSNFNDQLVALQPSGDEVIVLEDVSRFLSSFAIHPAGMLSGVTALHSGDGQRPSMLISSTPGGSQPQNLEVEGEYWEVTRGESLVVVAGRKLKALADDGGLVWEIDEKANYLQPRILGDESVAVVRCRFNPPWKCIERQLLHVDTGGRVVDQRELPAESCKHLKVDQAGRALTLDGWGRLKVYGLE